MAKFVLAGTAGCPAFSRAEMLADRLAASLPDFRVHKISHLAEDWPSWLQEVCVDNGWHHSSSPLVWRELLDRGGKGLYLGGLSEFEQYAAHYYGITPSTTTSTEAQIASENLETLKALKLEQQLAPKTQPIYVCITHAATTPTAYHLAALIATGEVFGKRLVKLKLFDLEERLPELKGMVMELEDLASPYLDSVHCTSSAQEAFTLASVVFVMEYSYLMEEKEEEEEVEEEGKEDENEEEEGVKEEKEKEKEKEEEKEEGEEKKEIGGEKERDEKEGEKEGEEQKGREKQKGEEEERGEKKEGENEEEKEEGGEEERRNTTRGTDRVSFEEQENKQEPIDEKQSASGDLREAAALYHRYAALLDFHAQKDVRVAVTGRHANTGAALMAKLASSLPPSSFAASSSLAEQQAKAILASKMNLNASDITQVGIWGRSYGLVMVDVSETRVHHFEGAITGPDPFALPVEKCVFERDWLSKELPKLLAARHGRMEGYRREGGAVSEAVSLARMMSEWCAEEAKKKEEEEKEEEEKEEEEEKKEEKKEEKREEEKKEKREEKKEEKREQEKREEGEEKEGQERDSNEEAEKFEARKNDGWSVGVVSDGWRSVGVVSDGTLYDIPKGLCFSLPVRCQDGLWTPVNSITLTQQLQALVSKHITALQSKLSTALSTIDTSDTDT